MFHCTNSHGKDITEKINDYHLLFYSEMIVSKNQQINPGYVKDHNQMNKNICMLKI